MFDLRKRFEKLDLSPAAALTKAKTVSVAPARTVSMQQAKPVAIQQPKVNYSAINQGLNSGRSWEDISRQTGTDLNTVKSYSQQTRPNYGISGPKVQSAPKLTMTQPRQTLSIAQPKQPTMQMSQPKLKTPSMSIGTVQTPKLTMAPRVKTDIQKFLEEHGNTRLYSGKSANDYINEYNSGDAWKQQQVRNDLTKKSSRTLDFGDAKTANERDEANTILASLKERGKDKFDLFESAAELGNNIVSSTASGLSTVSDAVQANGLAINMPKELQGKTTMTLIQDAYNKGRIDKQTYIDKINETNNRLDTVTGGASNKNTFDQALRAGALGFDLATTAVPFGSLAKGTTALAKGTKLLSGQGLKQAGVYAGKETLLNAATATPGALMRNGVNFDPLAAASEIGLSAAAGGLMSGTGVVGGSAYRAAKNGITDNIVAATDKRLAHAENYSGLTRNQFNALKDNEAFTLGDYGEYLGRTYLTDTANPRVISDINKISLQARHAAQNAGLDITSGSRRDVQDRIANYLEKRDLFKQGYKEAGEGGFQQVPFGKEPDAPLNPKSVDPTAALKAEAPSFGEFTKIDTTKPIDNPVIGRFENNMEQKGWSGLTMKTAQSLQSLNSRLKSAGHKTGVTTKDFGGSHPLEQVIKNDELFNKYPQLKEYTVVFADFHTPKKRGMTVAGDKTIFINSKLYEKDPTKLNSTLVHEIQHIKQDIRGMKKHDPFNDKPMSYMDKYNSEWEVDARRKQQEYVDWQNAQAHTQPTAPKVEAPQPKPEVPKTVKIFTKSRFNPESKGGYADYPVIRQEDNITLYQGTNPGENRQFWTPNKKYAEQFGSVREKTGSFYQVDNGNRMTDVYVEVPSKPVAQPKPEVAQAKATVSVDPTAALKAEALKYKTAEEFVNSHPIKQASTPTVDEAILGLMKGDYERISALAEKYRSEGKPLAATDFQQKADSILKQINQYTNPQQLKKYNTAYSLNKYRNFGERPTTDGQFKMDEMISKKANAISGNLDMNPEAKKLGIYTTVDNSHASEAQYITFVDELTGNEKTVRIANHSSAYSGYGDYNYHLSDYKNMKDIEKGVEKDFNNFLSESRKTRTAIYTQAHTPQPKPEVAQAKVEAPKQPTAFEKSLEQAGIAPKKTEAPKRPVAKETPLDPIEADYINETAARYSSPEQFLNETVDRIWRENKNGKGVDFQNNDGGIRKISNNTPLYRAFNDQYGMKPTKTAVRDMVEQRLAGKSGEFNDLLDETALPSIDTAVYKQLKERADAANGLKDTTDYSLAFEKNLEKAGLAPSRGTINKPVGKKQAVPQPTQVLKTTQIQQPSVTSVAKTSKTSQLAKAQEQKLTSTAQPLKESQVSTSSRSYADNTTNEIKKRGFTQSVKGSDEVSSQVRRKVSGEYNVRSTNKLALNADDYVKGDIGVVSKDVNSRLDTPLGKVTDQDIADSIAVAKRLDSMGKFNESQAIYDKLAEHGTKGGQAIQAFSLLQNRTPEGVKFQMLKNLKKAGVKLSDADQKTVGKLIDEVRKTKVGTEARDRALFKTLDYVSRKIPTNSSDKLVNIWRAGLLTAPKTTGGNLLGNTTELATQKLWANPIAVATDKFFSMFTGKRTKTIGKGTLKGMAKGTASGIDYMKTGFDPRNAGNMKYDAPRRVNYKSKVLDTYVNGVYRWMGAQDQPFYYGAKTAAAYDLAKADGINLGYKGQQLAEYVEKSVADGAWKPQTFKTAKDVTDYAKYAVYQNETMLGSMASGLKQGAGRYSKAGRAITDFILPFTQVPSSVAMRIIDRTPVGIVKEAVSQIKKGSFDQRAMAEAIGNGSFGIPVIAAGFALANSGELTGQYPTDQKEQKLWEAEGKQPYSVKIDGKWHSLNYMQPFGTLMAIGKQVSDDKADGKSDAEAWMNATGAAAKSIESQSFLQGLNGVLSAINDPKRSMNQYAKSTASSVIPNFIRSGAVASDDKQRETKTPFDAFKGAIPGVRQTLPTKLDMFGKELEARDDFVNQYMNPFKPSRVRNANDATTQELRRLQDAKNGIVTTEFTKSAIAGAELNDAQIRNLNELVNTEVKSRWDKAVQTSDYKSLSDEDKVDYLKKIKDGVADRVKAQFVKDNMINTTGKYGNKSIPNSPTSTSGKSDKPDTGWTDEYNAAKSAYDKESKNWTEIQRVGKEKELKTLGVKKNFSKDATRLYDMAEKDIYAYLDKSDDKKASDYLNQVVAYGDKMVEAGLWTTNKLRDKNGNVQYKRGYTGSTGGSRTTSRSSSAKTGSSSSSTKKGKFDYKLNMFSDSTRSSGSAADLYALLRKATMKG